MKSIYHIMEPLNSCGMSLTGFMSGTNIHLLTHVYYIERNFGGKNFSELKE